MAKDKFSPFSIARILQVHIVAYPITLSPPVLLAVQVLLTYTACL